jgi:hypothetical protein
METKTRGELIVICKEKSIQGYSKKTRSEIMDMIKTCQTQDTGKYRTNTKDQFYTKECVAQSCIQHIQQLLPIASNYLWIEPSAGNGAFLRNIPFEKIGLDIDPKSEDILKQDYLTWVPPATDSIVVGNPPFGRQSSLAKAFISKSCKYAKAIAFILPKSFTKPSMYNAFDLKFHLIYSVDLEKNAFVLNGSAYDVPCVFQLWQKMDIDRQVEEKINPVGFDYVKQNDSYHIAFRRVGGLAGKCYPKGKTFSDQSHYFIQLKDAAYTDQMIEKINQHTFPSNTVGPRSISKQETNAVLNLILQQVS